MPLGFAGLCEAYSLAPKEVDRFANLCASLETLDCCDPSALSVLDPATGEFLDLSFPGLRPGKQTCLISNRKKGVSKKNTLGVSSV